MSSGQAAVQICSIEVDERHSEDGSSARRIRLDAGALERLLQPCFNKPVTVLACVGAMRGGKSTFLSWLVRHCESPEDPARAGSEFQVAWGKTPCTSGIWAKCVDRGDDAVLFLDTQGLHDMSLDAQTTSNLFSLTCILATYLVFNVGRILSEDIIAQTAQFAVVARHAHPMEEGEDRILEFLVRDWENTEVEDESNVEELRRIWSQASADYTRETLLTPNNVAEIEQTRQALIGGFTQVSIALLPHPGLQITRPNFEESELMQKATEPFKVLFTDLCKRILSKASAIPNRSTGREIYFQLLEGCKELERSEVVIEPLFVATARANGAYALEQAQRVFLASFRYDLERFEPAARDAFQKFKSIARFGPVNVRKEFEDELVGFMEEAMDRVRAVDRQRRQAKTRMKQAAFAIVTGAVLAPWWIPAVVTFGARLGIRATTGAVLSIVSPETAAAIGVSSVLMFASTWWLRRQDASSNSNSEQGK